MNSSSSDSSTDETTPAYLVFMCDKADENTGVPSEPDVIPHYMVNEVIGASTPTSQSELRK